MRQNTVGKHTQIMFDSLHSLVAFNREKGKQRKGFDASFNAGLRNFGEVLEQAEKGLAREGIEALALASERLQDWERELNCEQFATFYDVSGAYGDVARALSGEPEHMVNFLMESEPRQERIVTLVLGICVPWHVETEAITKHGKELVALAEAIEATGLTCEIFADATTASGGYSGRISTRLKAPGDYFDIGAFMFALTHASMLRTLCLNAKHFYPTKFHTPMRIGNGYGGCQSDMINGEQDYPAGAIWLPPIMNSREAGAIVKPTLRKLGLLD